MLLTFAFLIAAAFAADEWQIGTIAGTGDSQGPTAGVAAAGSPVGSGWTVAFDAQDRLHITTIHGEVWRIHSGDTWELLWRAELPATDAAGNVFIAEARRIRLLAADGSLRTHVEGAGGGAIAIDADGSLYAGDFARCEVQKITAAGIEKIADANMLGITVCPDSSAYFTDMYRLQRVGTGVVAGGPKRSLCGR